MKEKTPWWMGYPAKEIVRSINLIIAAVICGQCITSRWWICACFWAGWAFLSACYLIGVYIEESTRAHLAAMEHWNVPQPAPRLMVEEDF